MEKVTLLRKEGDFSIYQADSGKTVLVKDCRARHVYTKPGYYVSHTSLAGRFDHPILKTPFKSAAQAARAGVLNGADFGTLNLRADYGDKRDFRKIDIFWRGEYKASTTWAKDLREARHAFSIQHANLAISEIVTKYD